MSAEEVSGPERFPAWATRLTKSGSRSEHRPLPQDDPRQRQPNIALAKRVLDWEPTVNLESGLKRTIDYFERLLPQLAD
jgi:UDP-glucuronate decarboxylase